MWILLEKDCLCDNLQDKVSDILIRHKSILDIMTKLEESNSRVNRAIAKSVTTCGCVGISASKQVLPDNDSSLSECKDFFKKHVDGELCSTCREVIEKEIGNHMFYVSALCNNLDLNLNSIISDELKKLNTLGIYSLL